MILGTWCGGFGAWKYGPWVGLLLGVIGGAHRWADPRPGDGAVQRRPRHLRRRHQHLRPWRGAASSPSRASRRTVAEPATHRRRRRPIPSINLPFISGGRLFGWRSPDITGWFERRHWFLISDIASLIRGVGRDVSFATLDHPRARAAVGVGPVAHAVRSAAAQFRRGAVRRIEPRRQHLPGALPGHGHQRRPRRARRRLLVGRRVERLPRGSDRRTGVHRPGDEHLRQLATRGGAQRRRALRLRHGAPSARCQERSRSVPRARHGTPHHGHPRAPKAPRDRRRLSASSSRSSPPSASRRSTSSHRR